MLYFLPLILLVAVVRLVSSAVRDKDGTFGKDLTTILAAHISRRTGRGIKESGALVRVGLRLTVAVIVVLILLSGF